MHKCECGNEFEGKYCNECGKKYEENIKDSVLNNTIKKEYDKTKKYKVTGTRTNDGEYFPGDLVEFIVPFMTDTSISVTSNDVRIKKESDNYSFIMPEKDVEISITIYNNMMNTNRNNPIGMMGMMGMSMMPVPFDINSNDDTKE